MTAPSKATHDVRVRDLQRALRALDGEETPEARAALGEWIEGVVDWNARVDLTAARTDEELVDLMIADALVLARHVPQGMRFVDVGCGAGAPGLALAIVRPDLEGVLVEPLDKRVAFLRRTIGTLEAQLGARAMVVRGRGEALVTQGIVYDVAISRATLQPPEWLALGTRLAPHGEVWVLLAQGEAPITPGWRVAADHRYTWPLTGAARRALRYVPNAGPTSSVRGSAQSLLGAAQSMSGAALSMPGSVQGAPRSIQGGPGSVQGGPGSVQGAPGSVQGAPGSAQGAPGSGASGRGKGQ